MESSDDDKSEYYISAHLDMSRKPSGTYYFNRQNNFDYMKNWSNYGKFHILPQSVFMERIVQYASPPFVPGALDTSKTYQMPSTSLTCVWATRIIPYDSTGQPLLTDTPGYSGVDAFGNTYVAMNYLGSNFVASLNRSYPDILFKLIYITGYGSTITKYNSDGNCVWMVLLKSATVSPSMQIDHLTVDKMGWTYVLGSGAGSVDIYNTNGSVVFSITSPEKSFIVAYNSAGIPMWYTYMTLGYKGYLHVDNQSVGNLYVINDCRSSIGAPCIYYENVMNGNPIPIVASGKNVATSTSVIVSIQRSSAYATVTLSVTPLSLGLSVGTRFALLGITNDNGSFNTVNVASVYGVSGNTFSYSNNTGTATYAISAVTGSPILTLSTDASGFYIAKLRSSSGSFQWASIIDGYRVYPWRNPVGDMANQWMTTDPSGNLYVSGYYTSITRISNAITSTRPIIEESGISAPPYAAPVSWVAYESDRNWSSVDCDAFGTKFVAAEYGGYIYVSLDNGETWIPRASVQLWSDVFVNYYGTIMIACVYNSIIYISLDSGENWIPSGGEGSKAKKWKAIAGSYDLTRLVAVAENDSIYYSLDSGNHWLISNAPVRNWVDVAYDKTSDSFIAVVASSGSVSYRSTDQGATWTTCGFASNWTAIAGPKNGGYNASGYTFFAVSSSTGIYGISYTGATWTLLSSSAQNFSSVCTTGSSGQNQLMFAAVKDGNVYQSSFSFETDWIPVSIPRLWSSMAVSYGTYGQGAVVIATAQNGQIYIARNTFPTVHSFIIKYDPSGTPLWTNYINTYEIEEESNYPYSITCLSNGNIVMNGRSGATTEFFSPENFETPVKRLNLLSGPWYIVCYTNQGLPLWVNYAYHDGIISSITTDEEDNIYCFGGNITSDVNLYTPTKQFIYTLPLSGKPSAVLMKFYPNGYPQSITRIVSSLNANNNVYGTSVSYSSFDKSIMLSGWYNQRAFGNIYFYKSPGTGTFVSLPTSDSSDGAIYVCKYSSSSAEQSFTIPAAPYNTSFNPRFVLGGTNCTFENGYLIQGNIESWTGYDGYDSTSYENDPLNTSLVDIDDLNFATVTYLGHKPGYKIPIENGLQVESPRLYCHLSFRMYEPSFPVNDPFPETPGSITYGYLPFFIRFSGFQFTSAFLNNSLNNNEPLQLLLFPTEGFPLLPSGVSPGDIIRLYVFNDQVQQYLTLTVESVTAYQIIFQENTRFATNQLKRTTENVQLQISFAQNTTILPAFYLHPLMDSGTIYTILQLQSE